MRSAETHHAWSARVFPLGRSTQPTVSKQAWTRPVQFMDRRPRRVWRLPAARNPRAAFAKRAWNGDSVGTVGGVMKSS